MRIKTMVLAATALALAIPRLTLAEIERPNHAPPYSVDLVDEAGAILPTFQYRGRTYVLGGVNQRYLVRVRNRSARRVEAVVSVDGRDVIDGRPSQWEKRGYLIEPRRELTIDGYRLNEASVAAFRFNSVSRSYAAQMGDARDVGVIGVAIFPERPPRITRAPAESLSRDRTAKEAQSKSVGGQPESGAAAASPPSADAFASPRPAERPGLGTEFAEEHVSRVVEVAFERLSSRPDAMLSLRYDDRQGLLALGIDVDGRAAVSREDGCLRETANPFRLDAFAEPPPGWSSR
jgi:hypothetical protein